MIGAFEIDSTLTYANAATVFQAGLKYIAAGTVNKKDLKDLKDLKNLKDDLNDPNPNLNLDLDPNNNIDIDCTRLTNFDSSALAVLMGWRRAALAKGIALKISNSPAKLLSLARTYGIDRLLCDQ